MAERWDEREREYRREESDYRNRPYGERGRTERAADEVRSWFGDDDAARRRQMDETRDDRQWPSRTSGSSTGRNRDEDYWARGRENRESFYRPNSAYPDSIPEPYATPSSYGTGYDNRSGGYAGRSGTYAGRGPRGYTRGDERIREDLCDRLTDDSRIDASDIDVQVKTGEVTLAGSVRTREEKRLTEDLAERISGVRDVSNHLKVKSTDEVIGTARSGASVLGLADNPPPPPTKTK